MHCGIGCKNGGTQALGTPITAGREGNMPFSRSGLQKMTPVKPEITNRIRMKYTKIGRVRFLSHLDFMALFHRVAVRAGVPIAFSQGFNPHPRIAFGPALSVGIESDTEFLDMETEAFIDLLDATKAMNNALAEGIRIVQSRVVPKSAPSLSGSISRYDYRVLVPEFYALNLEQRVSDFLARKSIIIAKEGKSKEIRPCIEAMTVTGAASSAGVAVTLQDKDEVKVRLQDVLMQCFEINSEQAVQFGVTRTGMYYRNQDLWKDPMDV
jgi:radical SAM-linked protein